MAYLMLGSVMILLSIVFRLAAVFRLTIPLVYALIVPTVFHEWYYANQTLANVIWYALLAVVVLRMCHASRCWGDVREKERLSRRLPAIADTPRHLPHKALISFSVQGYVIQDKRAAQAVCGRKVAF